MVILPNIKKYELYFKKYEFIHFSFLLIRFILKSMIHTFEV